ncbi:MAG: LapA family protein [Symploca sp. SIO2E9]|nr:LapA family protein [Symploca sp. SIO2E9]
MKSFTNVFTSLIVAIWIAAIAILSVQNFESVSLRFLSWESIKLPMGLVLAFSVSIGLIGGAIAPWLWQLCSGRSERQRLEEDLEFSEPE